MLPHGWQLADAIQDLTGRLTESTSRSIVGQLPSHIRCSGCRRRGCADRARSEFVQDLFLPQPFLKAFPRPETAFADPIARYERLLNPFVSIELSAIDPELSGWIHLVGPIEPYDGYIGDTDKRYCGPFLQRNWIAFRVTAEDRYQLPGDFRFFEIEAAKAEGEQSDLEEFYDQQH